MQMNTGLPAALCAAALSLCALPAMADDGQTVERLILRLATNGDQFQTLDANRLERLSGLAGTTLRGQRPMAGGNQLVRLAQPVGLDEARRIAARLAGDAEVVHAEPDVRMQIAATYPNDPYFASQWHLKGPGEGEAFGINLPSAWDLARGSESVVVAVIDTGILPHPDIDTNVLDGTGRVLPGYDFIDDLPTANDGDGRDADPTDPGDWTSAGECGDNEPPSSRPSSWHGTHVAGTIGALTDNGIGVAGVAWNVRLLPLRALGKCGGYLSDIIDAMYWAVGLPVPGVPDNANPARVLNMSLGAEISCGTSFQQAADAVMAAGGVVVAAAGNSNDFAVMYAPGNCAGVVTVAATNQLGQRASYSNFGPPIDLAAPGGHAGIDPQVWSTADGGSTTPLFDGAYSVKQGTSMAAPHVSGVAALILSLDPTLGASQIESLLTTHVTPFPQTGNPLDCTTNMCGAGIVNAAAVVQALADATPDGFGFASATDVAPSSVVTSGPMTVSGINVPVDVTVENGEYEVNGDGVWIGAAANVANDVGISAAGQVVNGDTIRVRHTAAAEYQATNMTTLWVGGVSGSFSSFTQAPPPPPPPVDDGDGNGGGGGGGALGWLSLMGLAIGAGLRRRRRGRS
ncbi:MAG: S8 family serine peptidase [Ectothiorhodospiraceae bacterium]|jgi:serine protease|nr:S8 family serine peptidase [Ectothiorhodospiraceae bacterium]